MDFQQSLRSLLASLLELRQVTHAAHWGYTGKEFMPLHELFGAQYDEILLEADRVAEFMRSNNLTPVFGLNDIIDETIIRSNISLAIKDKQTVNELIRSHKVLINYIHELLGTLTQEQNVLLTILADIEEYHSKQVWFLSNYA